MAFGYLRSVPKVDIQFERELYRVGDELRVRLSVTTDRPGIRVRRAVVELVLENRYTHTTVVRQMEVRMGRGAPPVRGVSAFERFPSVGNLDKRITQERIDRIVQGQERLFTDGVIRHRTEMFDLRFEVKPPAVQRTMQRQLKYMINVHFDLPRMRDVEIHKAVPVQL